MSTDSRSGASTSGYPALQRWLRFLGGIGVLLVIILLMVLATGSERYPGAVPERNRAHEIDATPLFYSEVENIFELDRAVREQMRTHKDKQNLE